MTRLHAGVAAAKSKERGDISQSFSCPMQFPFIVQNIQVYFWMMTRYFPLFVKKRGLTLKKGAKRGQNRENALLKGQPFFKRAVWGPWRCCTEFFLEIALKFFLNFFLQKSHF